MSKGDNEEQLARDRLREKTHPRDRSNRRKNKPKMRGKKICIVCGKTKPITEFATHHFAPDGRRYNCRLCGWEERWHRQKLWSEKHQPLGPSKKGMREQMGFRQPEKTPKVREHWRRSYADLGFEKRSFGWMGGFVKNRHVVQKEEIRTKEKVVVLLLDAC